MKGYLMPHAPIILPTIGISEADQVSRTYNAMMKIGEEIADEDPDTVILISPHGPRFSDAIPIYDQATYKGSLSAFGDFETTFEYEKDDAFIEALMHLNSEENGQFYRFRDEDFARFEMDNTLDHGALVPLYFVQQFCKNFQVVIMSDADFDPTALMKAGVLIRRTAAKVHKKIVVIASGDLSHTLSEQGPYHYHPSSKIVDQAVVDAFENSDLLPLATLKQDNVEEAGICGLNSILMLFGVYNHMMYRTKCLSYEGPFGVGYAVGTMTEETSSSEPDWMRQVLTALEEKAREERKRAHPFTRIAYEIIKQKVKTGISPVVRMKEQSCYIGEEKIPLSKMAFERLMEPCEGIFVSIKKNGALRGCIGTVNGDAQNACYKQIGYYALQAAFKDPRFDAVSISELSTITISIDLLSKMIATELPLKHDVEKYGLYICGNDSSGILLPNLPGVDNPVDQLHIASHKAGLSVDEIEEVYHFTVERCI